MSYTMKATLFVVFSLLLGAGTFFVIKSYQMRSRADAAEERLSTFCGLVNGMLKVDSWELSEKQSTQKLAIQQRVGRSGELDGIVALETCLPTPQSFDRDAWDKCVENNDDKCLVAMLKKAASMTMWHRR